MEPDELQLEEEMTAEEAKASMGNATFLQDQLLSQQGEAMMQETAPTDEELQLEDGVAEEDTTEEPQEDPAEMEERIKQEVLAEVRNELKDLLEDDTEEETKDKESDTETD